MPRKDVRDSELYRRILGQSLRQAGLGLESGNGSIDKRSSSRTGDAATPHLVPPRGGTSGDVSGDDRSFKSFPILGMSEDDNHNLVHQMAEMAATAATVATRDAVRAPRKASHLASIGASKDTSHSSHPQRHPTATEDAAESTTAETGHGEAGGHDAPNWSRSKSAIILLTATIAYAVIAEILVNTVDTVLDNVDIDEKFLGITLFALVPNTTEFLVSCLSIAAEIGLLTFSKNAISFAMNGNIALSMEIGSAYALQVCLLQVPCLVLFSGVYGQFINPDDVIDHTFSE